MGGGRIGASPGRVATQDVVTQGAAAQGVATQDVLWWHDAPPWGWREDGAV